MFLPCGRKLDSLDSLTLAYSKITKITGKVSALSIRIKEHITVLRRTSVRTLPPPPPPSKHKVEVHDSSEFQIECIILAYETEI